VKVVRAGAPELVIAALTVAATTVAGYLMAGGAGAATVLLAAVLVALVVLRTLVPAETAGPDRAAGSWRPRQPADPGTFASMSGYWRQRHSVSGGTTQLNSYETGLRRTLEHLLAARLAERHGINLYEEPDAARRAFCRNEHDTALWAWIAPEREPDPASERYGMPRRTLGRILDRMEQL
jgi:hypothetical protein